MKAKQQSPDGGWGVVRYLIVGGGLPDEDPCAFAGWYFVKAIAENIYKEWCKEYPSWNVMLVRNEKARFSHRWLRMSEILAGIGEQKTSCYEPNPHVVVLPKGRKRVVVIDNVRHAPDA